MIPTYSFTPSPATVGVVSKTNFATVKSRSTLALVAAVLRMPNLQNMVFTIAMDEEMAFVGMEKHSVGIEFAGAGIEAWHGMSQLTDDEGLNRCFVNFKPQTRWDVLKDIVNVFVQEICGRSRRCFRGVR